MRLCKKNPKRRILVTAILVVLLTLLVGSCRNAGKHLVISSEPERADAMLMLMGSIQDRVLHMADLYEKGVAPELLIVQEGSGANSVLKERGVHLPTTTMQVKQVFTELGIPSDSLTVLPGNARSTIMEAEQVCLYLQGHPGIDTLLIVSSPAHLRRASLIFRAACHKLEAPPVLCYSPTPYSNYRGDRWWKRREDVQQVLSEYLKITAFILFERRSLRKGVSP